MSSKLMGAVWDLDIPHSEAWVLMALADHADHDGKNVYPGIPLLQYKTGYSDRQIRRILQSLVKRRILACVSHSAGGPGRFNGYEIHLDHAPRKTRTKCQSSAPSREPKNPDKPSGLDSQNPDTVSASGDKNPDILSAEPGHFDHLTLTFRAPNPDISGFAYKEEPLRTIEPEKKKLPPPTPLEIVPEEFTGSKPETEMAKAVASVMGHKDVPEGAGGRQCFEIAKEFLAADISPLDVPVFEREWYQRKISQGKRHVLTLAILRADLPGWARARKMQSLQASLPAPQAGASWQARMFGLNKQAKKYSSN